MLRVPNFILAVIPAQINANTLNTMTAFAVNKHFDFDFTFNTALLFLSSRLADSSQTSSFTLFPTPSWVSTRVVEFILLWWKRSGTSS